jgi:hypothetical protein
MIHLIAKNVRIQQQAEGMGEMMERVGVDAGLAVRKAESAFAAASLCCLSCPKSRECRGWLKQHEGNTNTAPIFCPNAAFFACLRLRR